MLKCVLLIWFHRCTGAGQEGDQLSWSRGSLSIPPTITTAVSMVQQETSPTVLILSLHDELCTHVLHKHMFPGQGEAIPARRQKVCQPFTAPLLPQVKPQQVRANLPTLLCSDLGPSHSLHNFPSHCLPGAAMWEGHRCLMILAKARLNLACVRAPGLR